MLVEKDKEPFESARRLEWREVQKEEIAFWL